MLPGGDTNQAGVRRARQCYTCQHMQWLADDEWNCAVCEEICELQRLIHTHHWRPNYWQAILYFLTAINAMLRGLRPVNDA